MIEFPAVVSDGVAYIGNNHGTVRALSMRNGRVVWRRDVPRGKMAASPAVVGRDLVVHAMDGAVRILDRTTGRLRFAYHVGSPIESSPLVRDRIDYFGAWNGNVYALDLRTRRLRWLYRSGHKITSSAALAGRTLYIGDYGGRVLALAAGSGRLRWSARVNGRIYGTPAVWGGRVFVPSSSGGSLTAFSTRGRYLWRGHTGNYVDSSPAVWKTGLLRLVQRRTQRPGSAAASLTASTCRFPHSEYVPVSGNGGRLLLGTTLPISIRYGRSPPRRVGNTAGGTMTRSWPVGVGRSTASCASSTLSALR